MANILQYLYVRAESVRLTMANGERKTKIEIIIIIEFETRWTLQIVYEMKTDRV